MQKMKTNSWNIVFAVLLISVMAQAAVYQVGPEWSRKELGAVPWAELQPGDEVLIYSREEPYHEKWVLCRQGTAAQPIIIRGVPDAEGRLPVIDGADATTPAGLDYWNEQRGLIKIGGTTVPADTMPQYLQIENLELRYAADSYSFVDHEGVERTYAADAAAIFIEKVQHLRIRDCIIYGNGSGIVCREYNGATEDVVLENCHIYSNGVSRSASPPNLSVQADGVIVQYCQLGPLADGAEGENITSRGAGVVLRYNWIEGGSRLIDLPDSSWLYTSAWYQTSYVYGNVLIKHDDSRDDLVIGYGGDSGKYAYYRSGPLYFFNNTVVSVREGRTTLFELTTAGQQAQVENNILYTTADGTSLALLRTYGRLDYQYNWFNAGYQVSHEVFRGTNNNITANQEGEWPGFTDFEQADYTLSTGSPCRAAGTVAVPDTVSFQYVKHGMSTNRLQEVPPMLGAFGTETAPTVPTPVPTPTSTVVPMPTPTPTPVPGPETNHFIAWLLLLMS